jgi:hypothetical protein
VKLARCNAPPENLAENSMKKSSNSATITVAFVTAFWGGHLWMMDKEED